MPEKEKALGKLLLETRVRNFDAEEEKKGHLLLEKGTFYSNLGGTKSGYCHWNKDQQPGGVEGVQGHSPN